MRVKNARTAQQLFIAENLFAPSPVTEGAEIDFTPQESVVNADHASFEKSFSVRTIRSVDTSCSCLADGDVERRVLLELSCLGRDPVCITPSARHHVAAAKRSAASSQDNLFRVRSRAAFGSAVRGRFITGSRARCGKLIYSLRNAYWGAFFRRTCGPDRSVRFCDEPSNCRYFDTAPT